MGTHRQHPLRMANTLHTVNKQGFLQSSVLTESASGFTCHICPLERRAVLQGNVLPKNLPYVRMPQEGYWYEHAAEKTNV